jgi:hypothetical protein
MKRFLLLVLASSTLVACGGGGSGSSSNNNESGGGGGNDTTQLCIGSPIAINNSFVSGWKSIVELKKDNSTSTYPTGITVSAYDPSIYYAEKRYYFAVSNYYLNQSQTLGAYGSGINSFPNGVIVTKFDSSNPYPNNGESVTITIGYTITSNVTSPVISGDYTESFTCKVNYN